MAKFSKDGWRATLMPMYQLRVELVGIKPVIWRRFMVPTTIKLGKLHDVIQAAMGWHDVHLHEFIIAEVSYGIPVADDPSGLPLEDERRKSLKVALSGTKTFRYLYDFGDGWEHKIKVEKIWADDGGLKLPMFAGGENACPPEDVGGAQGYLDFLAAVTDPQHEEHAHLLEWVGGSFDPTAFDSLEVDAAFASINV